MKGITQILMDKSQKTNDNSIVLCLTSTNAFKRSLLILRRVVSCCSHLFKEQSKVFKIYSIVDTKS